VICRYIESPGAWFRAGPGGRVPLRAIRRGLL